MIVVCDIANNQYLFYFQGILIIVFREVYTITMLAADLQKSNYQSFSLMISEVRFIKSYALNGEASSVYRIIESNF